MKNKEPIQSEALIQAKKSDQMRIEELEAKVRFLTEKLDKFENRDR